MNAPRGLVRPSDLSGGMYIVRINRRVDRCGWADPSFNDAYEPELYAVSPDGQVLARYPHHL